MFATMAVGGQHSLPCLVLVRYGTLGRREGGGGLEESLVFTPSKGLIGSLGSSIMARGIPRDVGGMGDDGRGIIHTCARTGELGKR